MAIGNRKGIFYTFIAMGLVSLIVYSFVIHTGYMYRNTIAVTETRVQAIGDFLNDVELDIQRGLFISSFRSLLAIEDHISENQSFIDDIDEVFEEAMFNATIGNETNVFIEDASFTDWAERVKDEAANLDIVIDIQPSNLTIEHNDPWTIEVGLDVLFNITDARRTAGWVKQERVSTELDIAGLEDPVYALNTLGRIHNSIVRANETDFGDEDVLKEHLKYSYYVESDRAPSFLMRLEGNLSASAYGIESIVNVDEIIIQGLDENITSSVDYLYFGNETVSSCVVNETSNMTGYDWFRLDDSDSFHFDKYSVTCS